MKVDLSSVSETNYSEKYPPLASVEAIKEVNQHCFWTTKKGETMWIRDMNNNHLFHTIAMLERDAVEALADETVACSNTLSMLQGGMATYYCEQDLNRLFDTAPEQLVCRDVQYWIMICLAHKRNIIPEEKYQYVRVIVVEPKHFW